MYLGVCSILFFVLICYLLLIPIVIYIDSDTDQYFIQLKGLAKASIEGHKDEVVRIKLKIFF